MRPWRARTPYVRGQEVDVSAAGSKVKIFIIPTNEEMVASTSPERVPMGKPARGPRPMVVSTHLPSTTADREEPLPSPLGPLHNPANLMGIEACQKIMPKTPQVAVFDTAFHMTMPPKAYIYAIPYEYSPMNLRTS